MAWQPRRLAALLLAVHASAPSASGGDALPAIVEGTSLIVLTPEGGRVAGRDLIGAVVAGNDSLAGGRDAFRIEGVQVDSDDPEITLYDLAVRDPVSGGWEPYCVPDDRGVAGGFFLSGTWDARGTHRHDEGFSVTCTSGAIGKCVRYGHKPWKTAPDGRSGWDYHQACTRLIRADYCGNGRAHTREGVRIEILSRLDPMEEPGDRFTFEAAWTPEGARCVARPRLTTWSLEAIEAECPERLRGRIGEGATCGSGELANPEVLLVNKSPSGTR